MTDDAKGVDTTDEPSVLGAAPTLPFRRETRAERAERRLAERARAGDVDSSSIIADPTPTDAPTVPEPDTTQPDTSGVEYVFEPHTTSLPPLREYLRSLWDRRRFLRELARAQLQKERTRTVFGALWGILDPLLLSAIYILVFTIIRQGRRPTEFIPLLIAGIILFRMASGSMTAGATSISGSSNLMLNSTFPRALLPLTVVYQSLVKSVPVVPVYALIYWLMPTEPGWSLLLFPVLFTIQVVMMIGLALFTATLVVYFQDAKNMLTYVTRLMFFTSPVIWPITFLPPEMRRYLALSPLFALFASYQEIFGGVVPAIGQMLQAAAWAIGFLVVGAWLFLRHERDFAARL